jgi:hypothetical protein
MDTRIFERLKPVRRRQRILLVCRWAALGLLVNSLVGIAMGGLRWAGMGSHSAGWVLAIIAAGTCVGALIGWMRGRRWESAASAVDASYGLKDRTITAVDFVGRPGPSPVHALQVADAEEHLEDVVPSRVVPYRVPVSLVLGLGAFAVAMFLLLFPRPGEVRAGTPAPLEHVVAAAEDARTSLEELQEEAKKDKDLEKLVKHLIEKVEEMKQPGVDVKEALAKLSEMQAAIAGQQALYNVGLVDAQMQTLGEALASTQALESAGHSLQQSKYEKAAAELEQAEPKFERKEAKALEERLKKASQAMGAAGLGELSDITEEMAESVGDGQKMESALKKLGNLAKAHGRRKRIHELLTMQARNLSECKSNCQKNGGAKIRTKAKSTQPKTTWGRGVNGNVDGEKTKLDSGRKQEFVQGQVGEGPSETETTHSPEGREVASRKYSEMYQKYRKMTEAALNSEPIPLGHRQTIRRYFELIRPQGEEAKQAEGTPAPDAAK